MKRTWLYMCIGTLFSILNTSCTDDNSLFGGGESNSTQKIIISGEISQVNLTRVNDSGFADGDEIGVYIVDYNGTEPGTLAASGNRADNMKFTYAESDNKWTSSYDIYWKDDKTAIDIYGYYPYSTPGNIKEYSFEVSKDQSTDAAYGNLGGYEASDFLWAKAENVAPTEKTIPLSFSHKMASARVTLTEGSGFSDGEWASLDKAVLVMNTKRNATIDLSTGAVTATGDVASTGIIPYKYSDDFRAIVVPQTIEAGATLLTITVGGLPYKFSREEAFTFSPSKMHNFTIKVDKREDGGYKLTLTSESITAWENDNVSHSATTKEYVVINVETPGTLEDCIAAAGKDLTTLRNLKLTGKINSADFEVMRNKMNHLSALNLKDVEVENDEIPGDAMYEKTSLTTLILPDKLKTIGNAAFNGCNNLTGSLIIPEGVTDIQSTAFRNCSNLTGIVSLPSTLKNIGDGAFASCGFYSELIIPENVETIGSAAFSDCTNLHGELHLPDRLKSIGNNAFVSCGFTGSLTIPESITEIPTWCFYSCKFDGTLTLHDGIISIGGYAFSWCKFRGELVLPKDLATISEWAFSNNNFSGELKLPDNIISIGSYAFYLNQRLTGVLEIPNKVRAIGNWAFRDCSMLDGLIFPESLEAVGSNAFENCYYIGSITCKGTSPAYVASGAFDGVPKDNFTLEVPESAIVQYQTASGWSDFKRISAYRNLVVRPSTATAINTSVTRDLVLNADDEWVVESKPDWVTLDKTSGTGKTEIKLTFQEMSQGSDNRSGEVVFKLKNKEYTTKCTVTQYNYQYAEDEIVKLQSASKGSGVNLVFLGDGYNAKDISEGTYMNDINEAFGYFFNIEPYKTYKDYFNVYTGIAVSAESGIGGVNTIIYNRFNTTAKDGVTLGGRNSDSSDYSAIMSYACKAPTVSESNLSQTLIVIIPNTTDYGGITYLYDDGSAIAYCPKSSYDYPLDFRGIIQHEAGGHGFAKLGDEYIYHNAFYDACSCVDCSHNGIQSAKAKGWFVNLSMTGKTNEVPWSHLIYNDKYSQIVDIYEGGYMHSRGVYRSEQTSCMNNNIPYYSTISREAIVKRIKSIAGETYSFDEFVQNDVTDASVSTRSTAPWSGYSSRSTHQHAPVMMGKRPRLK